MRQSTRRENATKHAGGGPSIVGWMVNAFAIFFNLNAGGGGEGGGDGGGGSGGGGGDAKNKKKNDDADDDSSNANANANDISARSDVAVEEYGAIIGCILWLNRRCSLMVVSTSGLAILLYPSEATVSLPTTALCNAILGKMLKKLIDQQRPEGAKGCSKTKGMPSSHANSLFFFATALTLRAAAAHRAGGLTREAQLAVTAFSFAYAAMIAWARCTFARQHTVAQVLAGACLGTTSAYCTEIYFRPYWCVFFI